MIYVEKSINADNIDLRINEVMPKAKGPPPSPSKYQNSQKAWNATQTPK